MRVTVDVSAAGQAVGIGVYALSLARALAGTAAESDALSLFWSYRPGRPAPPLQTLGKRTILRGWRIPGRIVNLLWTTGLPPSVDTLTGHPDVFHNLSFPVPRRCDSALIMTVHDMAAYRLPGIRRDPAPAPESMAARLRRARAIVTDSRFAAEEMGALLPGPLPPVHAVPLGVDASRFRPCRAPDVLSRYGLSPGDYLLSVGTLQPRKNPLRLLEAWRRLPPSARPRLVWAGNPGWKDREIRAAFAAAAPEGVLWLRGVPADDLPALYGGALASCYPSLYEGFGLPILESMACGTPVLTSDRGAMKEVAGDAALLVDPESVDAMTAGLRTLIEDGTLREDLRAKGLARAKEFTWERSARRMWEIYREAAS